MNAKRKKAANRRTNGHSNGKAPHTIGDGLITPGCLMTRAEVMARFGWGEWAWKSAVKRGLKSRTLGKTRLVLTDDLIAYVKETEV